MLSKKEEATELWEDWRVCVVCLGRRGKGRVQTNFQSPGICIPTGTGSTLARPRDAQSGDAARRGAGAAASSRPPSPQQLAFLPSLGLAAGPGLAAGRKADSGAGIRGALTRSEQDPEPNSPASSAPAYLRRAPAPARRPGRAPGSGDREEELGPRGALQAEVKRSPGPHRRIRADRRGRMGLDRAATEGWADRRRVCTSAQRGGLRQAPPESWGGNLEPVAAAQSSCPQAAGTPPGTPCPQSTFPPHPLSSLLSSPPPPPRPPVPPQSHAHPVSHCSHP